MSPIELLEFLKKDSSNKMQESLDAIYEICQEQKERGLSDFSVSTIARLGHKRGVPKAQSIRNKTGEKYRALIQAFINCNTPNNSLRKLSKSDNDWISEITNPKHQILVRILASELKEATQMITEIIPPKQRIDIYDHKGDTQLNNSFKLTDLETRALQHLLSKDFQKAWKLTPTESGALLNEEEKLVFKVATLDALRKALEYLS
ncbi:gamma-mobile-trio protein GmtX [Ignatzschineria sp. LJL83]